jgi:acyl-CoA synthetase (AMP-forming)/AMP-acid ligase II
MMPAHLFHGLLGAVADHGKTCLETPDGRTLAYRALLEGTARKLAGYKLPKRVVFVADLPRNAMGKVEKNRLREIYRDVYRRD